MRIIKFTEIEKLVVGVVRYTAGRWSAEYRSRYKTGNLLSRALMYIVISEMFPHKFKRQHSRIIVRLQ